MKLKVIVSLIFFIIAAAAVTVKAFYVAVVNKEKLIAYSDSQFVRTQKIFPKRGNIYDRNMRPMAINIRKYNIFTIPKNGKMNIKAIKKLSLIAKTINFEKIYNKIKDRKRYTWIARKIDLNDKQVKSIKKLRTIYIEPEDSRFYPNHEVAGQMLGFVGIDNEGLGGLEFYYNKKLKGKPTVRKFYRDAKGRPVKITESNKNSGTRDLVLSIDKEIQAQVESFLKKGIEKHEASGGGAGVMDAETGEILAMANYPLFDPNFINKKSGPRRLQFITDPFEPGSVFKTFTIISAMENHIIKEDTNYFCEKGRLKIGKHWIKESDSSHQFEWLSVKDILKYSSNIGTTKIAFDLKYPMLKQTMYDLGFGKKSNIEYPGESRGILIKENNIKPIRLSNISFGQGIATTGVQILSAYASVANGGNYIQPTLIKRKKKDILRKRIFKKSTAKKVTRMLVDAVEDGTGTNAKLDHFKIAGKTSTAQRVKDTGGYEGYVSGFVGYPVDTQKKFVVFVYVDDPKKGYYGNAVAAPIFKNITKSILLKNKEYQNVNTMRIGKTSNMDRVKVSQSASFRVSKGSMPSFLGMDKKSASILLDKMELDYSIKGFGVVNQQFPNVGTKIDKNVRVMLSFKAPLYE